MSQNFILCPQVETKLANKREFEEILEFEENIYVYYRFYHYKCFLISVLHFLLTSQVNYPSPDVFHGAALVSEHAEILNVETRKAELPRGARI